MFCALFAALSRAAPAAATAAPAMPAAAALPAAAAAAVASVLADAEPAPDGGRAALCSGQDSAEKVDNFLISTRQRAIDVAMVTTEQGSSKYQPDAAADAAVEQLEDKPSSSTELADSAWAPKRRRTNKRKKVVDNEDANVSVESDSPQKDSPARNYRRPSEDNPFLKKFPPNWDSGMKLGAAVTVATMVIQGPYPKEDRSDSKDHYRFVKSGMLNVCSPASMRTFDEMTEKAENEMFAYCLLRVESARVTICPDAKVHQHAFRKPGRHCP
jgi:hypothetical protein